MNKRILELADQATIQEDSHGAFGEPTVNEYVDLEKFAELIIQECIKELEATQVCDPYTGEQFNYYNDVLADGIANIKEHFGVNNE